MHRFRLLFLLALMIATAGTCLAQEQSGDEGLWDALQNKYRDQDLNQGKDQSKTKEKEKDKPQIKQEQNQVRATVKSDDGQRRHWWSLPHFGHKKQDSASATGAKNKTVAARPMNKAAARKQKGKKSAASARRGRKTAATARSHSKNGAGKGQRVKTVSTTKARRKAAARKPVRHGCSAGEAKKGGCETARKRAKASTRAS